jgi:uncharacterized membrane protein YccC
MSELASILGDLTVTPMLAPIVQYGFAGFAVVLLAVLVWLIKQLLSLQEKTNRLIEANIEAIRELSNRTGDELKLIRELRDRLLARPCLISKD